jgi:hypothetical protein
MENGLIELYVYHNIVSMCVLVHYVFHWILNEFEQIYHGKNGKPHNESNWLLKISEFMNN